MAQRTIVKVSVAELTKYGFKDGEGYVSWSKDVSDADRAAVVPGASFDAEYYISDKGTRYLNKIVAGSKAAPVAAAPSAAAPVVDTERAKKFIPTFEKKDAPSATMSKDEWKAKDRSQLIGGLSHDAATIAAAIVAVDTTVEPLAVYKTLLVGMLEIRDGMK